ncbi:hypothetical protein ACHAP5_004360 [Fusarium lateritium]
MDVVPSKRLREIDEGDAQEDNCFVSFKGPNPLPQIDPSPLVICYGATFSVFINIFGPQDVASDVASRLSKASAFLQYPKSLEPGIIYSNPQFFRIPGMDEDMNEYVGLGDRVSNQRKAVMLAEIHDIFCSLAKVESFQAGLPQGIQAILKPWVLAITREKNK